MEVYCQLCGDDLTQTGGMVTSERNIYCNAPSPETSIACFMMAGLSEPFSTSIGDGIKMSIGNYYTPAQVQRAIAKGEIKQFGDLEKKLS